MATKSKKIYRKKEDRSLELVGYLPTEDVSSRVDEAESSIKDIKDKYVTKTEANNSFAGSAATQQALDGLNEATGNNTTEISNIKSALAKKQDKLTPGKGISINTTTNEISVNDGVFATTDYVMNNFVANSIYEQDKDGLDHDIYGLASRVTANESSINNLNNAVADRYTKAETDGKLDEKLSIITSSPKYWFDGSGKHRFCKIATITVTRALANRPIIFECIGRGMDSRQIISIRPTPSQATTGAGFLDITKTTNDLVWALKDEGNGVGSLYVMLSEPWGNVWVVRVSYDDIYVNVEMKMEACDGFPEGSILAKNVITALLADTATTAHTATLANSVNLPRTMNYDIDSLTQVNKVRFNEINNGSSIGGLGWNWWHVMTSQGEDSLYATQLAIMMAEGGVPQLAFRNKLANTWRDWAVAISDKTIGSQSVAYADRAGYANSSGTAAVCESTTLLAAEGTNLGAKIRSQYSTGTPGGSVTYHQATWYVIGNDGDTYNFSKMITTDNFGTNLTEALKNTKVEHTIRSDYTTYLGNGNNDSTSISISYDNDNGTSIKYTSYPNLKINYVTGYGVLEGNVYNHGTFQLAVSGKSNGTIFTRSVAKDGSAPSWVKLLTENDIADNLGTTDSKKVLSASQGSVLSGKVADNKNNIASLKTDVNGLMNMASGWQPKLNSETGATMQWLSFKKGSDYSISGIWCGSVDLKLSGSVGTNASSNFTIASSYESSFRNGSWYICVSPTKGGYVDTMAYGAEYLNTTAYGGKIWARRVFPAADTTYSFNIIAIRLY